ncbi:MAG: hypothetical protein D6726_03150 [Nitrospirae bacterium]|nr:MAG: hypothetical protein D6726_03150 [Nitrospirota bacterium]
MRTKLRNGEEVVYLARKHWIFLITFSVPLILSIALIGYTKTVHRFEDIAFILFVVSLLFFTYKVFERKFDIWVVTNHRIIDESGVFSHNFKESPLEKINNVNVRQSLMGRILGFGDVEIQTAAEGGDTIIYEAESPKKLQEAILNVLQEYEQYSHNYTNPMDSKECPMCAELVKKKAKICRFCGYKFDEDANMEVEAGDGDNG